MVYQMELPHKLRQYLSTFTKQKPEAIVQKVKAGDDFATQAITVMPTTNATSADVQFRTKLCKAGLLDVLLDLLDHCQDEDGGRKALENRALQPISGSTNPNLVPFASCWTNCLVNLLTEDAIRPESLLTKYRVKVAKRLGPLTKVMAASDNGISDTALFFSSRNEYLQNVLFYAGLVGNLALSPETVPILVGLDDNDSVRKFIVQALFLPIYRPDIVKEIEQLGSFISADFLIMLQNTACTALSEFVDIIPRGPPLQHLQGRCQPSDKGMEILRSLGNLPAVNPNFTGETNGGRNVTFATGLLDVVRSSETALSQNNGHSLDILFYCWGQLQSAFDATKNEFGEQASRNLVAIGLSTRSMTVITFAQTLLEGIHCYAIRPSAEESDTPGEIFVKPSDVVIGSLVANGFVEMLLRLLAKHAKDAFYGSSLVEIIEHHLETLGSMALASKTNKALIKRSSSLRKEVDRITAQAANEGPATKKRMAKSISTAKGIIDKAASGAPSNSAREEDYTGMACCRWCLKQVPQKELKRCSRCQRSEYCSKDCQAKDWKQGGHRKMCKLMMTNSARAEASGAGKREIRHERKHEENLSHAGNLLFNRRKEEILLQASLRGYNITDCVVLMDFRSTPATITVMTIPDYLVTLGSRENLWYDAAQYEHTKGVCERNKARKTVTVACSTAAFDGRGEMLLKSFFPQGVGGEDSMSWEDQQLANEFLLERHMHKFRNEDADGRKAMLDDLVNQRFR